MLQDVEAGRRTEIETLNGAIVRHADALGIDVPVNRAMVALVRGWERARGLRG
jgi:2-dehydropantoate 2-reductase